MDAEQIANGLSPTQLDYLRSFYDNEFPRKGRPHGLIARGLLQYAWGMNASMGYKGTPLGLAVRAILESRND